VRFSNSRWPTKFLRCLNNKKVFTIMSSSTFKMNWAFGQYFPIHFIALMPFKISGKLLEIRYTNNITVNIAHKSQFFISFLKAIALLKVGTKWYKICTTQISILRIPPGDPCVFIYFHAKESKFLMQHLFEFNINY